MFNAEEVAQGANLRGEKVIDTVIGQFAGYVSACWSNLEGAVVFKSEEAQQAVESVVAWLHSILGYGNGLEVDIARAINFASRENVSDTPDFILANYLMNCLRAYENTLNRRENWYDRKLEIG